MHPSDTSSYAAPHDHIGLPTCFQDGYKATMEINNAFHKGYISWQDDNIYVFSDRSGPLSPKELWGIPRQEFEQHWDEMMMTKTLFPGKNMVSSFL